VAQPPDTVGPCDGGTHTAQEQVLAESVMMIPQTRQRLENALHDLESFLVRVQDAHRVLVGIPRGMGRSKGCNTGRTAA
jgi:hypothetical protein